jgi:hypothetical protein
MQGRRKQKQQLGSSENFGFIYQAVRRPIPHDSTPWEIRRVLAILSDTCAWIQILGGCKSGNSAPEGVKTCLYSKQYLCLYRVHETKLEPAFRWFMSNGEWANTAEYRRTNTYRHERARVYQNKWNYSRHFEKVLPQNLVLFSLHQNNIFEKKMALGRLFYKMGVMALMCPILSRCDCINRSTNIRHNQMGQTPMFCIIPC